MKRVVFVVGPTASGKSALALQLAEEFGGDILNCDSLQACQRLDVGSAKPSRAERARVPHHLFDVVPPGERFTAGDFRRLALAALAEPGRLTFAVGGSGFYLRALEKGMFNVAAPHPETDRQIRARLIAEGGAALHEELARLDPAYAARVDPNDTYRVTRALMMMIDAGQTVTALRAAFVGEAFPYPHVKVGLDPGRDALAPLVAIRTARMIEDGVLDETRALIDEGHRLWPALASVGYRECVRVLDGDLALADLPALITQKTLALAKKQRTWFKRDPDIQWLDPADALAQARARVRSFIDPSVGPS